MYKHQKILMYEANILDHLMQPAKRGQKNPAMIQIINYERNVYMNNPKQYNIITKLK